MSPGLCSIMTPAPEVLPEIVVSHNEAHSSIASTYLPRSRISMNPSAMSNYRVSSNSEKQEPIDQVEDQACFPFFFPHLPT